MLEPLEMTPLSNLAKDEQLFAFKHHGFWHPMDTIRDRDHLNSLCEADTPPWLEFAPEYARPIPDVVLSSNGPVRRRVHG
jgi:glucose-1-phosphate cytidylyltransferase